ncbi:MAG: PEGA domain-containing protein [Treponema sp.]|nr:PEGA domain-containing protein [Treponema sp.]
MNCHKCKLYFIFCILLLIFPIAFASGKSYIRVTTTNVSLASVYIDGSYKGTSPLTVEVSPGSHSVRVEKSGYDTYRGTVNVADGYENTVSVTMQASVGSIRAEAKIGNRDFRGVDVYLDNLYKGKTPLTINDVKPGLHWLKFSKTGYDDVSDSVIVTAGYKNTVTAKFIGADLKVYSNISGASVYVDSQYMGTTPLLVSDLEVGTHRVQISKKHYSTYSVTTDYLKSNFSYTLTGDLEKISGYLNTNVNPSNATIYCNDEEISNYNEEIDEGTYTIKAHAFGYDDKTTTVTIARNKTSNISIIMDKAGFEVKSFRASCDAFNPKNNNRMKSVRFYISVSAPETGTLVITNEKGDTVASWDLKFETWDSFVDWNGRKDGKILPDGVYVATFKSAGFMRLATVTIDHKIKDYEQRARSKGFFFDVGSLKGPFYEGFTFGASGFYGRKHFYGGIAADFFMTKFNDDYKNYDFLKGLYFVDAEILGGASFNWYIFRPYAHLGLGYYFAYPNVKSKYKKYVKGTNGLSLSCTAGLDLVFEHFVIGGYYKLRKLNGAGYTDSFGVSFGWAFDK